MKKSFKSKTIGYWQNQLIKGIVAIATVFLTSVVAANPVLDNVASGNVSVQQSPNSTVINQSSQKAIINWRSFNIGQPESTHFQQPAGGVTLNRISPTQGPSSIYGRLTATGQIILMNPAGIFFGPSAYVNVGGLIATTANISNQDFLNGNYRFTHVSPYSGSIINEGQIIAAEHGLIALVGNNVQNKGLIQARMGKVVLASGSAFTMNFDGSNLISFTVDEKAVGDLRGVSNTGMISADGGKVIVTAKAAQGVLDHVINMDGIVQARSVGVQNGEIILSGDTDAGVVRVAAKMDASGKGAGEKGGKIHITGNKILVDSGAEIDVSGDKGGGEILIGGNYQGKGPLPNANATVVMPNTKLIADALTDGKGGDIIVWSDEVTKVYGNLSARGGAQGGDGGFIETSGHHILEVGDIAVDVSAPYGKTGEWLLDPWNVTITGSTANGAFDGGSPNIFTPTGSPATVSASTIASNLNTANVTITTGSTGAEAGDITVSSAITWISPYTLLLDAANNIIINAGITGLTGTLQLRAGNLANTITTGASGTINVKNFNLLRGTWSQVSTTLPSFNVSNNFQINSGTMGAANTDAAFIRAANASSTNLGQASNPVELVDIYGLQGAGSTTTTLGYYYVLNNNIDATVTSKWNSGSGFVPMGDYTGTFDGQSHVIQNLYINRPTTVNVGLFSVADNATIQNLGLINPDVTGESQVGPMIGIVFGGTLTNLFSEGGTVRNTSDWSLGGLIGFLWDFVTLSNSYSSTTVIGSGSGDIGGLVGTSGNNTISNTYSTGAVSGPGSIGGLFGTIRSGGSISNSFSTGLVTGSGTPGGLVGAIGAGGATISNSFWDTETSGQSTSAGGTGRTTAQMMTASTFSDAGWSIASSGFTGATPPAGTWLILDGQTRPMLRAEWSTNLNTAHQVQLMSTALDAAYTLTSNVDLSGINNTADIWGGSSSGFIPIGTVSAAFTGSLNGQGYEISNLYINRPSSQYVGLFGLIDDAAASVQNVALTNVNITGLQRVAGLAGRLFTGSISGVSVTGTVTGLDSPVGGIVGDNYGLIDQSYNAASIVGDLQAGGIAGYNYGTISNSYNIGSISGDVSGGLVGVLDAGGTISNSYSSGLVTGSLNTGGLIGVDTGGTVTASYWDTDTSGQLTSDGGTGLTTAQLLDFTTYDTDGWNISSTPSTGTTAPAATWLIFDDATRPMLAAEWSTTVRNAHQLQLMGMALDAEYTLANDIDASSTISSTTYGADVWGGTSGTGFVPVGRTTSAPFTGSLNGNGYVIDNLTITQTLPTLSGLGNFGEVGAGGAGTTPTYVGLFGVATNAIISNIGLTNVSITGGAGGTGGLAGALTGGTSTAAITNAYSIGSVSGSGAVGGLVGINQGLIAQSYSGGLMTGSAVSFATGGLVGYNELASFGVGSGTGYIEDSYSFANVVSNSTRTLGNRSHAGGLVGFNNFSTTTTRSYSFGSVTGTANTNLGGLIGTNNSGTVSNSYWDTQTSGRASSSGGTGRTTSQMMAQATFSGWDFTDVWGVIEGQSYPYLRSFYTSTPRAISGTSSSANSVVNLVVDGSILDSTYTGANGFFYFLEGDNQIGTNNTIADSTGILVYLDNAATQANVVAVTPGSGGSLSGSTQLALTANTVQIGNSASASFSNTLLDTAKGSLSDADILYSVSSNNLTLGNVTNPNVSLATTATTTYNINGNITASGTGALTFNGPVLLSADPTLTTATGNISFNDTLDSSVSARALIINSSGTTTFGGAVGEGSDLLSITANSGGSTVINGGSINTTGTIDISDAITLGADTTINSGNLFFGLTVDSDGNSTPRALTINTGSNQIGLLGDVGNTFALGAITLNSTGTTTLNGTISAASLATNSGGTTQINGGTVTTTGAAGQVYGDNVTINANSIFSANTGPISFAGTLDGFATNWNLTLNTTGATTFSGMVGNGVALGTLDVSGSSIKVNGGLIRTTGTQTYNDPVTINNNNATFTSTSGDINFTDTIDTDIAATGSYALTLNANDVLTLGGKIGTAPLTWGITSLSATANTININGGTDISLNPTIDTLGTQTYTGATVLGADTVLSSLTGNVSFISDATHTSTIDSDNALTPRALTVYFGNDNYFSADIGAGVPLASLTSTPLAATMSIHFQDTLNPANVINVTTVGDQTYGDDVHLDNPVSLTSTAGDIIFTTTDIGGPIVGGNVIGGGSTSFTINNAGLSSLAAGTITGVTLTKEGAGTFQLSGANTTGTTTINGGTLRLGSGASLASTSSIILADVAGATLDLNGNSQTIAGLSGGGTTGGNISLGAGTLTVNETGTETFGGIISGTGGLTKTGSGTLTLSGANTYLGTTLINAGTLVANNNTALGSVSAGTTVSDGATLQINNATIGNEAVTVTGTGIDGNGALIGTGTGSLSGAISLTGNTTIGGTGSLTLSGTISETGGARTVTKTDTGTVTLSGANTYSGGATVSAGILAAQNNNALGTASTTVNSGGTLQINDGITVANALTLNGSGAAGTEGALVGTGAATASGAITLGSDTTIGAINPTDTLTLSNTINGAAALTLEGAGSVILTGNIGNLTRLSSVTANSTAVIDAPLIRTTGDQTYAGTVLVGRAMTFDSSGGNIAFNGIVDGDGDFDLTVNSSGTTTFAGTVGATDALSSLAVTASGININGGSVATVGNQTYTGAITLGADTIFSTAAGSGNVTVAINNGIGGNRNVTFAGGMSSNESYMISGAIAANNVTVAGSGGSNSLTVNTGNTQTWNITGANAGSLATAGVTGSFTYGNIQSLTGGSGNDAFTLNGGSLAGALSGGAGTNSLTGANTANTWVITAANAGSVTGITGGFSNIQNVTGGSNGDTFTLNGGSLAGALSGGGGTNTLVGGNTANTWTLTALNAGSVTGITGGFSSIQNLTGGSGNDSFKLNGGSLAGSINGSGGVNTLTADNSANNWTVSGTNGGTVTGVGGTFSNIQNLTGGSSDDTFVFANGARITGIVNGGSLAGTNTLNFAQYSSPVNVTLTNTNTGSATNGGLITAFDNITNLINNGQLNELTLPNKANTLTITGAKLGFVNDPIYFDGFQRFRSSSGRDTVVFNTNAVVNASSNEVMVGSTTMFFENFTLTGGTSTTDIADVIQQGNPTTSTVTSTTNWTMTSVNQNITDMITQAAEDYYETLTQVKINPYCSQAN